MFRAMLRHEIVAMERSDVAVRREVVNTDINVVETNIHGNGHARM